MNTAYANTKEKRIGRDMSQLRSLKAAMDEYSAGHPASMWSLMLEQVINRAVEIESESASCNCKSCKGGSWQNASSAVSQLSTQAKDAGEEG